MNAESAAEDLENVSPPSSNGSEEALLHRYIFMLFQCGSHIDRHLVGRVRRLLDATVHSKPEHTTIDMWVDSPGGDAHAAYKLVLLLRSRCCQLNAVIPDYAKSAATLLVLGADRIYMDAESELGPLDTQIDHPDRDNVIISALDISNSFRNLGLQSVEIVLRGGKAIVDSTYLPRIEVLRSCLRFASRYTRPVVSKLDPSLITRANSQLKVAQHYAEILLGETRPPACDDDEDAPTPRDIAETLVNRYPDHGYVISREEAKEYLGLPVFDSKEYDLYRYARALYAAYEEQHKDMISFLHIDELTGSHQTQRESTVSPEPQGGEPVASHNSDEDNRNDGKEALPEKGSHHDSHQGVQSDDSGIGGAAVETSDELRTAGTGGQSGEV